MIKRMMLLSAALIMFNTAGADSSAARTDSESEDKKAEIQNAVNEKTAKIQTLTAEQSKLLEQQKQKRKELLKNNPKLRRMHLQILKQVRQLALELDANREISRMNDRLHEIERDLEKERRELNKLKEQQKPKAKETETDK